MNMKIDDIKEIQNHFVDTYHHHINNPLTAILGQSEFIKNLLAQYFSLNGLGQQRTKEAIQRCEGIQLQVSKIVEFLEHMKKAETLELDDEYPGSRIFKVY